MQGNPPPPPPPLRWRLLDTSNPQQWKDSNNLKKADIAHLTVTHKAVGGAAIDSDTLLESTVAEEKRLCSHGPSSDRIT